MEEVPDWPDSDPSKGRAHQVLSHQGTPETIHPWKGVSAEQWNDWKWQLSHRISTFDKLNAVIYLTKNEEEAIRLCWQKFPMAITPYFSSLLHPFNPRCPIRLQCIPRKKELLVGKNDMIDPCGEDRDAVVPNLIHRYPDRVLLLATTKCAVYCRYCTRRRLVGRREVDITQENVDAICRYLRKNKKIRDVLISGGDPFLLENTRLESILRQVRAIRHIEMVRIGTRVPVTLPMRVTESLTSMLRQYHPLFVNIHFTHPKEITPEVRQACGLLVDAGIPLGSQTVLLRGINDQPSTLKQLVHELLKIRVRPYYLYQCDPAMGIDHFKTPISKGIEIIQSLRGFTTGHAVPTYVIDAPGGGGKIPVGPDYVLGYQNGVMTLRNYAGEIYHYREAKKEV
ncbi:MAG: KamA family radical SAM protein [Thermodesulfobacteriota bacterium]